MGRVNMASEMTDRAFRARLVGTCLALVVLSACSQEPAEQDSATSDARKTSGPAPEKRAATREDCRNEVAAAFERLKTPGRPYREEATATAEGQTFRETVEVVPPDQMRLSDQFGWITHEYYIRIRQRAWANWSPFPWGWREEYPDLRFVQMKLRTSDAFAAVPNVPPPVYACLGTVEYEGTAYLGYRARAEQSIIVATVNGTLSEAQKREIDRMRQQMPREWRTVFVDPESRLPAYDLLARENQLGNPTSKVRYTYPDINIEPPLWCRLGLCRSVRR